MKYDLFTNTNFDTIINASEAVEIKMDISEFSVNSRTLTNIKKNFKVKQNEENFSD
jgi:hypothetical protein